MSSSRPGRTRMVSSPPRSATWTSSPAGHRPCSTSRGGHRGAGAGAAGPGLAAAALPHPHLQVGAVHELDELGVDPLREVRVGLERRADGLQLEAVHLRHKGDAVGVAHADAGDLPVLAVHRQRAADQRPFAHVHGGQVGGAGGIGPHLHLPQLLAHPGQRLPAAAGVDLQHGLCCAGRFMHMQPLSHAADAVAAHLRLAAVGVEDAHGAVCARRFRGADADDAVGTHREVPRRELPGQRNNVLRHAGGPAVQIDIVVGAALHFGK